MTGLEVEAGFEPVSGHKIVAGKPDCAFNPFYDSRGNPLEVRGAPRHLALRRRKTGALSVNCIPQSSPREEEKARSAFEKVDMPADRGLSQAWIVECARPPREARF